MISDPLIHFLLIGGALFALYAAVGGDRGPESNRILVDRDLVERLAARYRLVWQREPSPEVTRGLVDAYIRDEIFYREGLAAGLQEDDEVIRRRIRQKLEVMAEESQEDAAATDEQLEAFLVRHADRYALPAGFTLEQIYFDDSQRPPAAAERLAGEALSTIANGGVAPRGDSSMLPRKLDKASITRISRDFGEQFAQAIAHLPVGEWSGPVRSSYGFHVVRVIDREAGQIPKLALVRRQVERDFEAARREAAADQFYRSVRENYAIDYGGNVPAVVKPRP